MLKQTGSYKCSICGNEHPIFDEIEVKLCPTVDYKEGVAHWHKPYEDCNKYCPAHPDYKEVKKPKGSFKLAIVGSRDFTDYALMKKVLDPQLEKISLIISGGAKGADTLAQRYAKENGIPIHIYYPNYKEFGYSAPLRRNVVIANLAERMVAFGYADSKGTRHVVNKMAQLKKPYIFIQLSGCGFGIETSLDQ